jgi:hypothetical protein
MTGSHEVRGSIPLSSTKEISNLEELTGVGIAEFTATLQQPRFISHHSGLH